MADKIISRQLFDYFAQAEKTQKDNTQLFNARKMIVVSSQDYNNLIKH